MKRKMIIRVCVKLANGKQDTIYFTGFPTRDILRQFVRGDFRTVVEAADPGIAASDSSHDYWKRTVMVANAVIGTITYSKISLYDLNDSEKEFLVKDGTLVTNPVGGI